MQEGSFFSTPSQAFIICRFFDDGHSDRCEVIPHGSFDLRFSNEHSICYGSELVEHKNVHVFPHNVPDYQSLLTNKVIKAIGVFHTFSMKDLFLGGLLSLATRWQRLNNKVLICPFFFCRGEEVLCNFYILESVF